MPFGPALLVHLLLLLLHMLVPQLLVVPKQGGNLHTHTCAGH
jgi:hypothetical protein